jgi:hypothetical protein
VSLPWGTYVCCYGQRLGFIRGTGSFQLHADSQTVQLYIVELDVGFYSEDGVTWVSMLLCNPDGVVEAKQELQHE